MTKKHLSKALKTATIASGLLASACAYTPVEEVQTISRPQAQAVRNITSFSQSLSCMDRLFASFGVRNVVVTSQGIPDATGEIETGTKEMLISAISRMSKSSGAFTFVDFDQSQFDINALQNLVGFTDQFVIPNYYIRGAITQLDEQVVSENAAAGISIFDFDAGVSADQIISMVSVDTNVGDLLNRQILSGTSANNSIAVRRTGKSADGGASLSNPELGFDISVNFNRSEGMHQAVRTLVELSTIESLGKLTQVPYWRCLGIDQTNPAVEAQARDWFNAMAPTERTTFVQEALYSQKLYNGAATGVLDAATRDAIGAYQSSNSMLANGQVTFDLYASLISGDLAIGKRPASGQLAKRLDPSAVKGPAPLGLNITTARGVSPLYQVGETLEVQLRTTRDAYAYCYYQSADGVVAQIFPNRFQPNALIASNAEIQVPGPASGFQIMLDKPGVREEVLCLATADQVASDLPADLRVEDLSPLPISSLGQLVEAYRNAGRDRIVVKRLQVQVAG